VSFSRISVVDGRPLAEKSGEFRSKAVRFIPFSPATISAFAALAALTLSLFALPAHAGIEDAVKAMQTGDVVTAEKELQVLAKERDPRAQFFLGLYVYGNPDSKLFDLDKAAPLLLDAAERGYTPAMVPLAGAYAEGKGVPKSYFESYKWVAIAERWNVPNVGALLEQVSHELKPEEIEKAKAAAAAFTFKTK
jgi:TPR repeat protein